MPKIVINNAVHSSTMPTLTNGQIYLPLFYIEGMLNLLGYVIIGEIIPRFFKKHTELGDVGFSYIVWYGLIRTVLEPLRPASYQMGSGGYWSWVWSIMFILLGSLVIFLNHLIRYLIRKHKNQNVIRFKSFNSNLSVTIGLSLVAVSLFTVGITLMSTNKFVSELEWTPFNLGLFLTILGGSVTFFVLSTVLELIERKASNE
jgi:hypothetical protein